MASSKDFIDFVCEQISSSGNVSSRKMFGDYVVYCEAKPVLLVCDNTVFVKKLPGVKELLEKNEKEIESGFPYTGAKEHYIIDIEENLAVEIVQLLTRILPSPTKKKI